jgi:hypothetical protein
LTYVPKHLSKPLFVTLLIFSLAIVVTPLNEASATAVAVSPASLGYDVSFPQCGATLPSNAGFGIVGVNDGHPISANPCLANEISWTASTTSGAPSFYMNTDAPGPAGTSNWPTNQSSPKACTGVNSVACAYDYGWNAGLNSFGNAVIAETSLGTSSPLTAVTSAHWWLDVETGNHWETIESAYGPSGQSQSIDQNMLLGAIAYLRSVNIVNVGIYATAQQWRTITGTPPTAFATIPAWMPGYPTLSAAQAACLTPSFDGGRVAMIQYPQSGLDGDYVCGLVSTPAAASITVAAGASYSQQLSVGGATGTITYVQQTGTPSLIVSPTGLVSASGPLVAGTYSATGTTSDAQGDSGTFSFVLSVGTILQTEVPPVTLKTTQTTTYSQQLVVTGNAAPATFVETTGQPSLLVSPTGLVTTSGTLAAGSYTITGTTSDGVGDSGVFTFTMNVGAITQNAPTVEAVASSASGTFSAQLNVSHNTGPVTFSQTGGKVLVVSSSGLVTTNNVTLNPGTYKIIGTTSDAYGDQGTFAFSLNVLASGTTTTTTLPGSASTTATTTTTLPPGPVASDVVGHATAGKTVVLKILGTGFYGRPTVTSHSGTKALVVSDNGTALGVRVYVKPRSRNGVFTFTITFANGKVTQVKYNQR